MRPLLIATATIFSVFAEWAIADLESDRAALSAYLSGALSQEDGFEDRFAAEVWLVDMQQRLAPLLTDPDERLDLLTELKRKKFAEFAQLVKDNPKSWDGMPPKP